MCASNEKTYGDLITTANAYTEQYETDLSKIETLEAFFNSAISRFNTLGKLCENCVINGSKIDGGNMYAYADKMSGLLTELDTYRKKINAVVSSNEAKISEYETLKTTDCGICDECIAKQQAAAKNNTEDDDTQQEK